MNVQKVRSQFSGRRKGAQGVVIRTDLGEFKILHDDPKQPTIPVECVKIGRNVHGLQHGARRTFDNGDTVAAIVKS